VDSPNVGTLCGRKQEGISKGVTPRQLEKLLDVPQPRVSELLNGKISRMTADLLAKYLYRLGREVTMTTKTSRGRAAAMA
jgi:predicted XRE-type DNA-binding protein